jgi:hypothetical protein
MKNPCGGSNKICSEDWHTKRAKKLRREKKIKRTKDRESLSCLKIPYFDDMIMTLEELEDERHDELCYDMMTEYVGRAYKRDFYKIMSSMQYDPLEQHKHKFVEMAKSAELGLKKLNMFQLTSYIEQNVVFPYEVTIDDYSLCDYNLHVNNAHILCAFSNSDVVFDKCLYCPDRYIISNTKTVIDFCTINHGDKNFVLLNYEHREVYDEESDESEYDSGGSYYSTEMNCIADKYCLILDIVNTDRTETYVSIMRYYLERMSSRQLFDRYENICNTVRYAKTIMRKMYGSNTNALSLDFYADVYPKHSMLSTYGGYRLTFDLCDSSVGKCVLINVVRKSLQMLRIPLTISSDIYWLHTYMYYVKYVVNSHNGLSRIMKIVSDPIKSLNPFTHKRFHVILMTVFCRFGLLEPNLMWYICEYL